MKIIVLSSGSKGNVTYVEYKNTKILIDLGMPLTYIKNNLENYNIKIDDIDAVLITHAHNDHVRCLMPYVKKYKSKIYLTTKMNKEINLEKYENIEETKEIKEIKIDIIHTSHDKPSIGFILKGDKELVYITDTGYIKESYYEKLTNKDCYIIESNHDIEMLMNGDYPYHLKRRILSDKGHLSNIIAAEHISKLVGIKTKTIILAHLSEHNNDKLIAYNTMKDMLKNDEINIIVSNQSEPLQPIEL